MDDGEAGVPAIKGFSLVSRARRVSVKGFMRSTITSGHKDRGGKRNVDDPEMLSPRSKRTTVIEEDSKQVIVGRPRWRKARSRSKISAQATKRTVIEEPAHTPPVLREVQPSAISSGSTIKGKPVPQKSVPVSPRAQLQVAPASQPAPSPRARAVSPPPRAVSPPARAVSPPARAVSPQPTRVQPSGPGKTMGIMRRISAKVLPGSNRKQNNIRATIESLPDISETIQPGKEPLTLPGNNHAAQPTTPPLSDTTSSPTTRQNKAPSFAAIPEDESTTGLYEDPEFPCTSESLFRDDLSRIDPKIRWLRPEEYTDSPTLFLGGVEAGDVCQGDLGDCWFLSSLSCVGNDPTLIPKLFASTHEPGRYDLRFFKNGRWRPVSIDDRIPCLPDGKGGYQPAYGRGLDKNEIWVPLVEKAYAKLHGCYENLEGGRISQGLADLTGGVAEKIYLTDDSEKADVSSGALWQRFKQFIANGSLMGCGYGDMDVKIEGEGASGILANHAYGVIDCQEIKGFRLIKCRNPWGHAGEWKGAWSDKSDLWKKHPDIAAKLNYVDKDDGQFWIQYEDFVATFNECYICHMFDEHNFKRVSYGDMFYEETDGGCPLMGKHYQPTWRSNPQYLLKTSPTEPTVVFLSMSQPDSRLDTGKIDYHLSIGFVIIKGTKVDVNSFSEYPRWLKPPNKETLVGRCPHMDHRFVSDEFVLPPSNGVPYYIVPYAIKEPGFDNIDFKDGRFLFEVYTTDKTVEFAEVDQATDLFIYQIEGEFTAQNSGGQWKNKTWSKNPQFSFKTTKPHNFLSITLSGERSLEHMSTVLFRDGDNAGSIKEFRQDYLLGYSEFVPVETALYNVGPLPEYNYVIVPCTYKAGATGKFTLLVFSKEELEWTGNFRVKTQEAGRLTDRLPKSTRKFALPMGYDLHPPKMIRSARAHSQFHVHRRSSTDGVTLDDD